MASGSVIGLMAGETAMDCDVVTVLGSLCMAAYTLQLCVSTRARYIAYNMHEKVILLRTHAITIIKNHSPVASTSAIQLNGIQFGKLNDARVNGRQYCSNTTDFGPLRFPLAPWRTPWLRIIH